MENNVIMNNEATEVAEAATAAKKIDLKKGLTAAVIGVAVITAGVFVAKKIAAKKKAKKLAEAEAAEGIEICDEVLVTVEE